jgi:hypothetical protein
MNLPDNIRYSIEWYLCLLAIAICLVVYTYQLNWGAVMGWICAGALCIVVIQKEEKEND